MRRALLAGVVLSSVLAGQALQAHGWPELIVAVSAGAFFWFLHEVIRWPS